MRDRSQGISRQPSALLSTLSDNRFHITEHVLFQKMWKRDTGGNIKVKGNRNACEPQHMFLRAMKVIPLGKTVPEVIRNWKNILAVGELEHVSSIHTMA